VLGASFDPPERNARFAEEEGFPFPLLTAPRSMAEAFGAAGDGDAFTRRVSVLVAPDGTVEATWHVRDPAAHAAVVLERLSDRP